MLILWLTNADSILLLIFLFALKVIRVFLQKNTLNKKFKENNSIFFHFHTTFLGFLPSMYLEGIIQLTRIKSKINFNYFKFDIKLDIKLENESNSITSRRKATHYVGCRK